MREELRTALTAAMRRRDPVAVSALRGALAALDDAGAVPLPDPADAAGPVAGGEHVAAVAGLGATEVPRRELTTDDERVVVRREVDERLAVATEVEGLGRADRAEGLRAEAAVLLGLLGESRSTPTRAPGQR